MEPYGISELPLDIGALNALVELPRVRENDHIAARRQVIAGECVLASRAALSVLEHDHGIPPRRGEERRASPRGCRRVVHPGRNDSRSRAGSVCERDLRVPSRLTGYG